MAKIFKNYRTETKKQWGRDMEQDEPLDQEQIRLGALLRIADATEIMAQNFVKLQKDYEYMLNSRNEYRDKYEEKLRSNISLRGVITKMKKKTGRG